MFNNCSNIETDKKIINIKGEYIMKKENKILLLDVLLFVIYCFVCHKTQQGFIDSSYNWWFTLSVAVAGLFVIDKRKWFKE